MAVFSRGDSLGALDDTGISKYLFSVGDNEGAEDYAPTGATGQSLDFLKKAYSHTNAVFGFINDLGDLPGELHSLISAGSIQADKSLVGKSLKVTLDSFYINSFPGLGTHDVLCEFSAKNQIKTDVEDVRQVLRFKANDKSSASTTGTPIYLGLNAGNDGICFEGRTINVSSSDDDILLETFDSTLFKAGLTLLNTAQPVIKPFSSLVISAMKSVLARNKNKQIHNFNLGLDFDSSPTAVKLRTGSYIVIQSDDQLKLDDYCWNPSHRALEKRVGPNKTPEFNYMIFRISLYQGTN